MRSIPEDCTLSVRSANAETSQCLGCFRQVAANVLCQEVKDSKCMKNLFVWCVVFTTCTTWLIDVMVLTGGLVIADCLSADAQFSWSTKDVTSIIKNEKVEYHIVHIPSRALVMPQLLQSKRTALNNSHIQACSMCAVQFQFVKVSCPTRQSRVIPQVFGTEYLSPSISCAFWTVPPSWAPDCSDCSF